MEYYVPSFSVKNILTPEKDIKFVLKTWAMASDHSESNYKYSQFISIYIRATRQFYPLDMKLLYVLEFAWVTHMCIKKGSVKPMSQNKQ